MPRWSLPTGVFAQHTKAALSALTPLMPARPPSGRARGEFTLLVEAGSETETVSEASSLDADAQVDARLREQLGAGVAPSRAAREVAEALGVRRKDVYSRALALSEQLGAAAEGDARQ